MALKRIQKEISQMQSDCPLEEFRSVRKVGGTCSTMRLESQVQETHPTRAGYLYSTTSILKTTPSIGRLGRVDNPEAHLSPLFGVQLWTADV